MRIDPTYLVSCSNSSLPYFTLMKSAMNANVAHRVVPVIGDSFDMTALITVLERNWDVGSHVVLMHDTMWMTPETPKLIEQANPQIWATAAFGGQCNLGLYRMDYLISRKDEILRQKNCTKKEAIQFEGRLWRECPIREEFPDARMEELGIERPYGGAERMIELYTSVGIYKAKANRGQTCQTGEYILHA